jgi:acyl-CoA thioesterase I
MRQTSLSRGLLRYGAMRLARKLGLVAMLLLAPVAQAAAQTRVLAFGDSLVQGYGLAVEDGFVPQLEDWLGENGAADVTVINAGVSGDTTAGGLSRIDWALGDAPDAVIVELGANDMLRGLPLDALRTNLEGILDAIEAQDLPILLTSVPTIANYGADYEDEFRAIYEDLAPRYDAILYPNFFAGILEGRTRAEAQALMQPDGIHPNARGVRATVEHIGPVVLDLVAKAEGSRRD